MLLPYRVNQNAFCRLRINFFKVNQNAFCRLRINFFNELIPGFGRHYMIVQCLH